MAVTSLTHCSTSSHEYVRNCIKISNVLRYIFKSGAAYLDTDLTSKTRASALIHSRFLTLKNGKRLLKNTIFARDIGNKTQNSI